MATVGGIAVEILRGNTTPIEQSVEVWTVPGLSGVGAQLLGVNQSSFSYLAILYGSVEARLDNLAGLQGTIVSITDDLSVARGACLVLSVGIPDRGTVSYEGSIVQRASVTISGVRTA